MSNEIITENEDFIAKMIAIGGKEWSKTQYPRFYFNAEAFVNLGDNPNSEHLRLLREAKIFFDFKDFSLHWWSKDKWTKDKDVWLIENAYDEVKAQLGM